MSDTHDLTEPRKSLADAFGAEINPLEQYTDRFETVDVDPFELFLTDVLAPRELSQRTVEGHERVWRQWCEHMESENRHPACPNVEHVRLFAQDELAEKGNEPRTVSEKLRKLNALYRYWQDDPVFPHPRDYNPISLATATIDLTYPERKDPPHLSTEELRQVLQTITDIRDYAIVFLQLKLGLRATEVCNLRLKEVALPNQDLNHHYCKLGSHDLLRNRENAMVIPHDREGNKSRRTRLLPLDDETQGVLRDYLLIRPDIGSSTLFLSKNRYRKLRKKAINQIWKTAFHPKYEETEQHRAVTSHYGRHKFTTYWRVEMDLNRELVKYMRGDTPGSADIEERGAIDEYIHSYYEDIESIYRSQSYTLER